MIKAITDPVWGSVIYLCVDEDPVKVDRHVMKNFDLVCPIGQNETTGECWGIEGRPIAYLWIPEWPFGSIRTCHIGAVVHECIHAASHVLDVVGALYDRDSKGLCHEAQAYLADYYVRSILDVLSTQKRVKVPKKKPKKAKTLTHKQGKKRVKK